MPIWTSVESLLLGGGFGHRLLLLFLQLLQALFDALVDCALAPEDVELLLLQIAHAALQLLSRRLNARGLALEDVHSVETFGVCESIFFPKFGQLVACLALGIDEQHLGRVLIHCHQRAAESSCLSFVGVFPNVILLWEAVCLQSGEDLFHLAFAVLLPDMPCGGLGK